MRSPVLSFTSTPLSALNFVTQTSEKQWEAVFDSLYRGSEAGEVWRLQGGVMVLRGEKEPQEERSGETLAASADADVALSDTMGGRYWDQLHLE